MSFKDRLDAAAQLAQALIAYRGKKPLVLAIPRGGVPMGKFIAEQLQGDFDVVLVRKLGAQYSPARLPIDRSRWRSKTTYPPSAG